MKKKFDRFFYLHFTDKVIAKIIIAAIWCLGIRKGMRFIYFRSGYTNKADNSTVCYGEIKGFSWVWATRTKFGFDIDVHLFNEDHAAKKALGRSDIYIEKEFFNTGSFRIKEFLQLLLAQPLLRKNFKNVYQPA